jgi:hypothetical protein
VIGEAQGDVVWFPPARAADAAALADAGDSELRALGGFGGFFVARSGGVRVVAGPTLASVYAASAEGVAAWSTHAVAAAMLTTDRPELDPGALPELLAAEFVGGERTLLRGVRTLPAATVVDVGEDTVDERSYWPAKERWRPVSGDPHQSGADALLRHLERSVAAVARPYLGLTDGLDSRVVAVGLAEIGAPATTFTWGSPDWPDVIGAARVATQLGLDHQVVPLEFAHDADALARVDTLARASDGVGRAAFGGPVWPAPMDALVTGAGGEVGRAFYRNWRPDEPAPTDQAAATRLLAELLGGRLPDAAPPVRAALTERVAAWMADAYGAGGEGWRALDVLYGDQRVRHWGRAMAPPEGFPLVTGLGDPELWQAMIAVPDDDRKQSGFHRELLRRRAPGLVPVEPTPPRAARLRRIPRAVARRLRARRGAAPGFLASYWSENPRLREWMVEEVIDSPLLAEGLGDEWVAAARRRFVAPDAAYDDETLLWAATAVTLESAISGLVGMAASG